MSPKSSSSKRLVLIDAHAILHRAYHALPQFSNSRGEPTGGLYGLSAMLIKIITMFRPDYIAAAYDLPKPTFRHEAYKAYKDGRAKADDALIAQMKRSREIFDAFNIPIYDKEGFEADDILGTIVEITKHQETITKGKKGDFAVEIIIASGDMDTLQLVSGKRVQVFTLKKGINETMLYDEEEVKVRYGFGPELLPDFKGLKGDPSDNIKGIAGIGDKTATELILKFGSIEHLYKVLTKGKEALLKEGIKPRVVELLEKGKEEAEFSKLLGTIRRDVPITFSFPEKLWCENVDISKAEKLFGELEFRQLVQRLKEAVGKIKGDTPTTPSRGLDTPPQPPRLADSALPLRKGGEGGDGGRKSGALRGEVAEKTSGQTSLTDALAASGISPQELKETSVALWLINSNITNPTLEDIYGFAQTRDFETAKTTVFAEIKARNLTRVFEEIEKPLIPVIEQMNARGVKIDEAYLEKLSKEYHKELSALEKDIHLLAGIEFNVNSPKQLGDILFNKMGLKVARQKKTAGGALSTRESELEKMRELHPIINKILDHREFQKLLSTYIDTLPAMAGSDGRLHADFLQAGAATGRMASQHPNLQNIPIQTKRGRRIRNAFVAEKKCVLLAVDYSQIELRVAAILSCDEKLVHIFQAGEDVHTSVAAYVFRVPRDEITKEMRREAKVINFGMLYGMGVTALQQALKEGNTAVSRADAQRFLNDYFTHFHTLAEYIEGVKAGAVTNGYTETLFGRRRYHEAIHSHIPYIRAAAERQAMNAPFQGTAADLIKLAMIRVDEFLRKEKLETQVSLILSVHDELVYEIPEALAQTLAPQIKKIIEEVLSPKLSRGVPIVAEAKAGKNWGEMEKM